MPPRRAPQAAIAAASDGSVLLNVAELLSETQHARLRKQLGSASIFIGIPLNEKDAAEIIERLDGAAAEASAHLLGGRANKLRQVSSKRAPKRR